MGPANSLVYNAPDSTQRVIVNREPVGQELGIEYGRGEEDNRDFFAQGDCDAVFLDLIQELGWFDDLWEKRDDLAPQSAELLKSIKKKGAATASSSADK